jgi:hypothetical protein
MSKSADAQILDEREKDRRRAEVMALASAMLTSSRTITLNGQEVKETAELVAAAALQHHAAILSELAK